MLYIVGTHNDQYWTGGPGPRVRMTNLIAFAAKMDKMTANAVRLYAIYNEYHSATIRKLRDKIVAVTINDTDHYCKEYPGFVLTKTREEAMLMAADEAGFMVSEHHNARIISVEEQ